MEGWTGLGTIGSPPQTDLHTMATNRGSLDIRLRAQFRNEVLVSYWAHWRLHFEHLAPSRRRRREPAEGSVAALDP